MSVIAVYRDLLEFTRMRTLMTLDEISRSPQAADILSWRPGPGRAHLAWQLLHVGVTEELFATERLIPGAAPAYPDLVPRFKGGSVPDDDIPSVSLIRKVLEDSRVHLLATLDTFSDDDLTTIFPWFKERGWPFSRVLQLLGWHEAHHQGQAHITFNLWKASHVA